MLHALDLLSTFAFALVGARIAANRKMDYAGISLIALVASVSGGTLRNIFLGIKPIWITDIWVISVVLFAVLITLITGRVEIGKWLLMLDTIGLAIATMSGSLFATEQLTTWYAAIILGVITAVTGGLLRDVLCQVEPVLLHRETIGTSSFVGAVTFVGLMQFDFNVTYAAIIGGLLVVLTRFISIRFNLNLPRIK
ncbi:MAG: hypothetical protein RLZ57_7 [Actinomycetota bacterium]